MEQNIQLRDLTTLGVGGRPARYYRPGCVRELAEVLEDCRSADLSWRILGGGSNLLVDDGALPWAVIRMAAPGFADIARNGDRVTAGAGVPTARLLAFCRREGLAGLEFLAGLPGTVGGAVVGNAGAWGRSVGEAVRSVAALAPDGSRRSLNREQAGFRYRGSDLHSAVVTEVQFELQPDSPHRIAERATEYARRRRASQPLSERSAGCVFRNPDGASAGRLLDECGLKGRRIGGAEVSEIHANFIINRGGATAEDVLSLISEMACRVEKEFDIELEPEVRHWASHWPTAPGPIAPRPRSALELEEI